MSSSKRHVLDQTLVIEEVRCLIIEALCLVQIVQNWFTGISNPMEDSCLGLCCSGVDRMDEDVV